MPNLTVPIEILGRDGRPSIDFSLWVERVTVDSLITGTGSPEGVVPSAAGREYMDENGTAGAIKYIKRVNSVAGDKALGWVLI